LGGHSERASDAQHDPGADFEDGELDFQLLQTCFAAIKFPVRRARKRVKLFVETGTRPGERPMPSLVDSVAAWNSGNPLTSWR